MFIDQFLASFDEPPRRLTFDIDTFDDPTHGDQQLTFFHGYYEQYQYQPRLITCAQNDLVVMACLLHGTAHAALGADDDLEYLVGRLRAKWPDVVIELRGDSGMAVPAMYDVCERLDVQYTFGLRLNPVLQRRSDALLAEAVEQYEQTGQPQRLFTAFWYQAGSWALPRWVVVKAERMRRAPIVVRSSPIVPAHACCRRRLTTSTPIVVKARTAIRNSSADCRSTVSAIIASWPTSFGSTCTPPRSIFWYGYATTWPTRRRRILLSNFRTRLWRVMPATVLQPATRSRSVGRGPCCTGCGGGRGADGDDTTGRQ